MRVRQKNPLLGGLIPVSLAFSLVLSSVPAIAAPGDVNSTNSGRDVQGGTYFNTQGSRTTFVNPNGSLWVRSGVVVRGLESNASGTPTGNGGTMYFRAPGNVIRVDGTIDASAVKNGSFYTGNGGKVFMDSAYLFNNGNIFANGFNGGLIQLNVGGMTMTPNARMSAQGFGGNGGTININSPGVVDIQNGAIIDSSGRVTGTFDTNIINIEGSVVNNDGIIRANGFNVVDFKANNSDAAIMSANPQLANNLPPGTISGGTGQGVIMGEPQDHIVPGAPLNRGGTIRLVATGQNLASNTAVNNADNAMLSASEKSNINTRNEQLARRDGSIINNGFLVAQGSTSLKGGTVMLASADDAMNFGTIDVSGGSGISTTTGGTGGGDGGTVAITAMDRVINHGFIQANGGNGGNGVSVDAASGSGSDAVAQVTTSAGNGGDAGLIAFSYNTMENRGKIQANGGAGGTGGNANAFDTELAPDQTSDATARATAIAGAGGQGGDGGLIVFSGNANPTGGGLVTALGGRGGRGGNATAEAWARARDGNATAITNTTAGDAGAGGLRGTVVAPTPGNFASDQVYLASAGGFGNGGGQQRTRVTWEQGQNAVIEGETIRGTAGSTQQGEHNIVQQTRRNEIAVHGETALLMSRAGGAGTVSNTLSGRLDDAIIRTVANPLGTSGAGGAGLAAVKGATNFTVASTTPGSMLTNDLSNGNTNPIFFNLNNLTMLNNGTIDNNMHWSPGVHQVGPGFHDFSFAVGGGHVNLMSSDSIINDGIFVSRGLWSGGSVNLKANQDIINNGVTLTVAFNPHLSSGFTRAPGYISSHAGSTILKAGRNILNNYKLNSNEGMSDIHPALAGRTWLPFLNAAQIGSTLYAQAGGNITNASGALWAADALTYRDSSVDNGNQNPGNAIGGIMTLSAGGTLAFNSPATVRGESWVGSSGNFKFSSFDGLTRVTNQNGNVFTNP